MIEYGPKRWRQFLKALDRSPGTTRIWSPGGDACTLRQDFGDVQASVFLSGHQDGHNALFMDFAFYYPALPKRDFPWFEIQFRTAPQLLDEPSTLQLVRNCLDSVSTYSRVIESMNEGAAGEGCLNELFGLKGPQPTMWPDWALHYGLACALSGKRLSASWLRNAKDLFTTHSWARFPERPDWEVVSEQGRIIERFCWAQLHWVYATLGEGAGGMLRGKPE